MVLKISLAPNNHIAVITVNAPLLRLCVMHYRDLNDSLLLNCCRGFWSASKSFWSSLWAMIYMASGESPFIVTVFGERLEMLFLVEDGSQLL